MGYTALQSILTVYTEVEGREMSREASKEVPGSMHTYF